MSAKADGPERNPMNKRMERRIARVEQKLLAAETAREKPAQEEKRREQAPRDEDIDRASIPPGRVD